MLGRVLLIWDSTIKECVVRFVALPVLYISDFTDLSTKIAIIEDNGLWRLRDDLHANCKILFLNEPPLLHFPERDIMILSLLTDEDLVRVCETTAYLGNLFQEERLWEKKIIVAFGEDFLKWRPSHKRMKEWYFILKGS